jgi:uncharacterized membrane protein YjjB (DUF3815 family)
VGIWGAPEDATEAVAALAAAVVGIAGNHIGHLARDHYRSFDVASIIVAVFALGLAVWLDTTAGLTPAALYALAAAVVGVVVVHVAHESVRWLAPAVRARIGW